MKKRKRIKARGITKYVQLSTEGYQILPKLQVPYTLPNGEIKTAKYKLVNVLKGHLNDNALYKLDERSISYWLSLK